MQSRSQLRRDSRPLAWLLPTLRLLPLLAPCQLWLSCAAHGLSGAFLALHTRARCAVCVVVRKQCAWGAVLVLHVDMEQAVLQPKSRVCHMQLAVPGRCWPGVVALMHGKGCPNRQRTGTVSLQEKRCWYSLLQYL